MLPRFGEIKTYIIIIIIIIIAGIGLAVNETHLTATGIRMSMGSHGITRYPPPDRGDLPAIICISLQLIYLPLMRISERVMHRSIELLLHISRLSNASVYLLL